MKAKTVFVIGAGASVEAGLPTSILLKGKIAKLLNIKFDHWKQVAGDPIIADSLIEIEKLSDGTRGDINPYLHEAWHIRDALPLTPSIDNFIDQHRDNTKIATCGKLAIVRSILEAEKNSKLSFGADMSDQRVHFDKLEDTWYIPFFHLITENCEKKELKERFQSVVLIVFNYDRCIEHFLYNALKKFYRTSEQEASDLVKSIVIYHPYGSVGFLPWEGVGHAVDFGKDPSALQLVILANGIKTFTEGTDPNSSEILAIREQILRTTRLVFMGFAFHDLNMSLITPDLKTNISNGVQCHATTYGSSDSDKEVIRSQINKLYGYNVGPKMVDMRPF